MTAQIRLSDKDRAEIKAIMSRASVRGFVKDVAREFGLTIDTLIGRSLEPKICRVRQIIWYRAHAEGYSLPQIGKVFGRDHTTIMHGIRNEKKRRGEA